MEIDKELISPFSNFEIDSDENSNSSGNEESDNDELYDTDGNLKPYRDTRKGQVYLLGDWYMKPSKICEIIFGDLDIYKKQASLLAYRKEYGKAYEVYRKILMEFKHNPNHKIEVIDALVQCAAKARLSKELKIGFRALSKTVETLGDQINFWTTTVVVGEFDSSVVDGPKHLEAIIYLCSLTECGRHWLLVDKISRDFIPEKSNFRLGAKLRAYFWLKSEFKVLTQPSDSVEKITEKQMLRIRSDLEDNYSEDELVEARNQIWVKFIRTNKDTDEEGGEEPPPHAVKLCGKMKTQEDLYEMRKRFITIYPWLFEGLEEISQNLLKEEKFANECDADKSVDEILDELRDLENTSVNN